MKNITNIYTNQIGASTSKQSGSVVVLVAVLLPLLIGFLALVVDVGYLLLTRNKMQIAADAAALVAAGSLAHGQDINAAQALALTATAANGFTNGVNTTLITVAIPPGGIESFANDPTYVRVTVLQATKTFLASIFGIGNALTSASAVSGPAGVGNPCLLTLGASGSGALSVVGNSSVNASNCGIFVNSNSSDAIRLTGNVTVTAGSISVVGGISKNGNVTISPVKTGASVSVNPFLNFPVPTFTSCTFTNYSRSGNGDIALTPGTYCGGINITGNHAVSLASGMYVLYGGGFNVSGNTSPISGTGVTIYNSGSGISGPNAFSGLSLTGNVVMNLSAPIAGSYAGMLFMQDPLNTQTASIVGNSGSIFAGNLYFPQSQLNLTGNSGTSIPMGSVVAQKVSLTGNSNLSMTNIYGSSGSTGIRMGLYQ